MANPPVIPNLPPTPTRSDGPADFTPKADAMMGALQPMIVKQNELAAWMNSQSIAPGLPSITGNGNKFLKVSEGGVGLEWDEAGQLIGDVLLTSRQVASNFLRTDGSIYLQSAYPDLFAQLGLLGGVSGQAWSLKTSGVGTSITDVASDLKGVVIAIGASTSIIRSTDNGETWTVIPGVLPASQSGKCIATDRKGVWCIGHSNGGVRSTDNGLTWGVGGVGQASSIDTDGLGTWIATRGGSSQINKSLDNGVTWTGSTVSSNYLYAVCTDRKGVWVVAGIEGAMRRSADNGLTWSPVTLSSATSEVVAGCPKAIATDGEGRWVRVNSNTSISSSVDNGVTWQSAVGGLTTTPATAFTGVAASGAGAFSAVGAGGAIITSRNSGASWTYPTTPLDGSAGNSIARLSDSGLVSVAVAGKIAVSRAVFSYDSATQFKTPTIYDPSGLTSYIKARRTP